MATSTPTTTVSSDHQALVAQAVAAETAATGATLDRMCDDAIAAVLARIARAR